ncbi:uncharacterized protein [Montipora foliosa]|uniref:uncharacterized protein n=1 Tax=Montipora foliosa TaxID=591990 RepID=UPI0035F11AEE
MPCFPAVLLSIFAVCGLEWPSAVQARKFANCNFKITENTTGTQRLKAIFSAKLPPYQNLSHSCVVKANESNHFLRVKAKRNKQPKGFLHLTVYGLAGEEETTFLGHLDVSKSQSDWSSLTLCPPLSRNEIQYKKLVFSGSPSLEFTVQIESLSGAINLNHPEEFEINQMNRRSVFQFTPPARISDTQLDITVTSVSDVPAYLKVSQVCKDVEGSIELIDYKRESIRLSFAKKGRITLSKVSVPPLTDSKSKWFIGIALKNDTGTTKYERRKTVVLTLKRSFDYSYAYPISVLVISTILSGVVVSVFAFVSFKERFYAKTVNFFDHLSDCGEVVNKRWFRSSPKTFSYITGIVGFVLMVGASQFVFANWDVMIHEGDRDNCYHNDFCYRVSPWHDIPYNLMMSNLVYIFHGIILAACVCFMEANVLRKSRQPNNHDLKGKISFSIGYAFAWAFFFEGCFSSIYHICPSKMTFQFDTAFMFVISGFTVILLYNGFKKNAENVGNAENTENAGNAENAENAGNAENAKNVENAENAGNAENTENVDNAENAENPKNEKSPVGAANFFLFVLVPFLIFNYFGALHHSELHHSAKGMNSSVKIAFFVSLGIWWLLGVTGWVVYKVWIPALSNTGNSGPFKVVLSIFLGVVVLLPVVFCVVYVQNLPQAFLLSCIVVSLLVVFGKGFYVCYKSDVDCHEDCRLFSLRFVYVSGTLALWVSALYFFIFKPTTNKVKSPEISRDLNQECKYMDFFDYHDMWHILSSHALLMGAYLLMFMGYQPLNPPTAAGETVPVNTHPPRRNQVKPK